MKKSIIILASATLCLLAGVVLISFLASRSSYYEAEIYPCNFKKYKSFKLVFKGPETYLERVEFDTSFVLRNQLMLDRKNGQLTIVEELTEGLIFPPNIGRDLGLDWVFPRTIKIVARDSISGDRVFSISCSRYLISREIYELINVGRIMEDIMDELSKNPSPSVSRKIKTSHENYYTKSGSDPII
jgi:hypothetical protein